MTADASSSKANIDPTELSKFERQAERWWDKNGVFKPLHDINPLRVNYIDQNATLQDRKVLDVGCGGGLLCEAMAQKGAQVTGIDCGKNAIATAKLHLHESQLNIDYRVARVENLLPQEQSVYDVVVCLEMLEHVPDPEAIVAACAKLTCPKGHVFFSTLNRNIKSFLGAIVGAEYVLRLLPQGTHRYDRFIKPSELFAVARQNNLHLKDCTGIHYNLLRKSYSLGRNIDINYIMHYQRQA